MTPARTIPVNSFRWGNDGDKITEHTWISLVVGASGAMRVLGYDMGPETKKMTGHFDYGYWLDITADDAPAFLATVLGLAMVDEGATFDTIRDASKDNGVPFIEGDGPYSENLEKIA